MNVAIYLLKNTNKNKNGNINTTLDFYRYISEPLSKLKFEGMLLLGDFVFCFFFVQLEDMLHYRNMKVITCSTVIYQVFKTKLKLFRER